MALTNYLKTSLREMFEYLRNPQENISMSYQPKSIFRSYSAAIVMLVTMFFGHTYRYGSIVSVLPESHSWHSDF